ncbi:MAG: hypothetical protein EOO20_21025 [Chryseobacterium sp.]|nr:MAG: hypothetical protein EOO20_21025 [Chryseobacterium sp.]
MKNFQKFFYNNLWRENIDVFKLDFYFREPNMMIELNFPFKDTYGKFRNFILFQNPGDDLWCVRDEQVMLARLSRIHGAWKQLSGEVLPKVFIQAAGTFIQQHYYDSVPLQIKERWPSIIDSVEKKSDAEIAIVCKPQVNLNTFQSIFCKHVNRLFQQDISMNLKVYSYNFAQDFNYKLEVKSKRDAISYLKLS